MLGYSGVISVILAILRLPTASVLLLIKAEFKIKRGIPSRKAISKDTAKLALELGHASQDLIFCRYRELVKPEAAAKYWNIRPATKTNLVKLEPIAA